MCFKYLPIVLLKHFYFVCLVLCFNFNISEFSLFGLRYAILNISSGTNDKFKDILLSDSASFKIVYGQNSPTYFVNGKIIQVKTKNKNSAILQENQSNVSFPVNDTNNRGCESYINDDLPENFVALVSRGECSFEQKIRVANENKAQAIIIYNNEADVFTMITREKSIVNVLVSKYVGQILLQCLQESFSDTFVTIEPSYFEFEDSRGGFTAKASVYFVFVSFFCVIVITLGWIVVFYVQRIRSATAKKQLEKNLKKATSKALQQVPIRKLKIDDKELEDSCIICLENFVINDQIRELPCKHFFHQKEIDLWLFENRNCPMCKIDILQAYGIEIKKNQSFLKKLLDRLLSRSNTLDQTNFETTNQIESPGDDLNNSQIVNPVFNQNDESIEIEIQNQPQIPTQDALPDHIPDHIPDHLPENLPDLSDHINHDSVSIKATSENNLKIIDTVVQNPNEINIQQSEES